MMLFFSQWILVTSLGAPAVNFLWPNVTLHVQIIVNMLFMLLLLFFFIIFFLYKQFILYFVITLTIIFIFEMNL